MSMEICVLSDARIASTEEWQSSIDTEELPLRLPDHKLLTETIGGRLQVQLRDEYTTIEYSIVDLQELEETYKNINFEHHWTNVIAFTWATDFKEEIAAWMAATAYARATQGVIFDEHDGRFLSPAESLELVTELERLLPAKEAALHSILQQLKSKS
jgi:hypothetical protein